MRVCVLPPTIRTAAKAANEAECQYPVLAIEELLAGKLKALVQRVHPRDLYDMYHFLKSQVPHDSLMLRKITTLFASTMDHDLRTYAPNRLEEAFSDKSLRDLLYPMLRSDDRPQAADMLSFVRPLISGIVGSTESTSFLDAMARGEYRPDLLFPDDPEISARIASHPALVWKAQSMAAFLARGGKEPRRP